MEKRKIDNRLFIVDFDSIKVIKDFNSRREFGDIDELAEQIKNQGLLAPITLLEVQNKRGEEEYHLIDGERRYRAIKRLKKQGIDVEVRAFVFTEMSDKEAYIQQLQRNEGKPFNEYEYGILTRNMMAQFGMTLQEVAKALGKNVGGLQYALQDLEFSPEIQALLKDNKISGSTVRRIKADIYSIEGLSDEEKEEILTESIVRAHKKCLERKGKSIHRKDLSEEYQHIKDTNIIRKGLVTLKLVFEDMKSRGEIDRLNIGEIMSLLTKKEYRKKTIYEIIKEINDKAKDVS